MGALKPQNVAGNASASNVDGAVHHSLGLKHILRRFRSPGGVKVLDLGPATGHNVKFLSTFVSKLYIADLSRTISTQSGRSGLEKNKLSRILEKDLPPVSEGPIDLVLAWDLLNYLDDEQVTTLGRHLAMACGRDSLVFILVANRPEVPELPGRYIILDPETLRYENKSKRTKPAPGYKEPQLERLMPAFEVETSYLLRSGIQEYVLTTRTVD